MGLPGYLYPGDRTLSQEANGSRVDWAWWQTKNPCALRAGNRKENNKACDCVDLERQVL